MDIVHIGDEVGNWRKEKILGAGGFGYVILWRNKISNETIALKECRWGNDPSMTEKLRNRWKQEVEMMCRLDHSNVVKGIPVPQELDVPTTELPLLAMEYCSNGDLRKVLNQPENCCGLKENKVRLIVKHVSSAVNYLHSLRIIHRDLKPENVVIQEQNGKLTFKLIDLGYAKELDQSSLCTSFVGTLQYLAPELFMCQKYSSTVDYWSLGLVVHEIIAGTRPFLPEKAPAEWIPIIRRKKPTDIRAYLDADKNIVFSDQISPYHHISNTFQKAMEKWLQLMLDWDPKKRGRDENTTANNLLETILSTKVASFFCVDSLKLLTFPVTENMSYSEFCSKLAEVSSIPVNQQEILLPNGQEPDPDKDVQQFLSDMDKDEVISFLFHKNHSSVLPTYVSVIPPTVETMMRNPHKEVPYQEQRASWPQAVHLCQVETLLLQRLIASFKVALTRLLTDTSYAHKSVSRMTADMNKLLSKCVLFKSSLEQDMQSYESQAKIGGFTSEGLFEDWKNTLENLKKVDILRQKIVSLESCSCSITANTLELQKSSYARTKGTNPLEDVYQKVLQTYSEMKKRSSEKRKIPQDNFEIVKLLIMCLQQSHTIREDVISFLRRLQGVKKEVSDSLPTVVNLQKEIAEWDRQITLWQSQRQNSLWKVIKNLVEKSHSFDRSSSPLLLSSSPRRSSSPYNELAIYSNGLSMSPKPSYMLRTPPVITPPSWRNPFENLSFNQSRGMSGSTLMSDGASLSMLLTQAAEENKRVMQENDSIVESFQTMMEVLKSYKNENDPSS